MFNLVSLFMEIAVNYGYESSRGSNKQQNDVTQKSICLFYYENQRK